MIKTTGQAILQSATTGEIFVIEASELHWETRSSNDVRQGLRHTAGVERKTSEGSRVACQWTVAEFPPGTLGHVGHHSIGSTMLQDFGIAIRTTWQT
jgi:hypothetical protein